MKTFITASIAIVVAATGIYHLNNIRNATSNVPVRQIVGSPRVPRSLAQSQSVKIVNPHDHVPIHDSRYITIRVQKTLSDEEVLARFVKGFFGGHVFAMERGALKALKLEITRFEALGYRPISTQIWSVTELSAQKIPPPHALLFGVFRVVDSAIEARAPQHRGASTHSYVDFAFGSDNGFIAGVHRFSVSRTAIDPRETEPEADGEVTIEFAHSGCNPREDKPLKPDVLQKLHLWYSLLLFREGVAEVMKT